MPRYTDRTVRNVIFNVLLESGIYPSQWTKGVVIPIFKKGAKDDVNNYRGITLVSCFGKLFSTILNERLKVWSIENDISSDAQFGFKQDHSTIDAIFILQNLVNDYLSRGKQLHCAFIDFIKAFDSVNRNGVWYKLIKSGVNGKMLNLIRCMYNSIKCCVKHLNNLSDFFECEMGLLQGEILSPILFSLFLNDIEMCFQENPNEGISIDQLSIYLLLFADDAVIMSETAEG